MEVSGQKSVVSKCEQKKSMNKRILCPCFVRRDFCALLSRRRAAAVEDTQDWMARVRPVASDTGPELFRREFRALGYVEGKNIVLSIDPLMISSTGLPPWQTSSSVSKLTCILASATPAAVAAKNATRTIPIVFMAALILLRLGWLTAWRGLGETSQGSPPLPWR